MSINVILVTLGSAGDVNPFIDLGKAMVARGHRVTLVTHSHFLPTVQEENLNFVEIRSEEGEDYERITANPDLWHPRRSLQVLAREIVAPGIPKAYDAIEQLHIPGGTIVVAHNLVLGARIANETMSVPLVTVQLAPFSLRSMINPPRLPYGRAVRWFGQLGARVMYRIMDFLLDRVLYDPTNEFRQAHGLPPVRRLMKDWWLSPQRVVGLWPDWFCAKQPDWPECVRLTGFVLHEMSPTADRDPAVESYFSDGEPPILFTPGTAMRHAHDFFVAAAEVCRHIGRRGVLVTPHTEQIPSRLPDMVTHFPYVPFREYLARSAAVVHHGGIGTCAQAMLSCLLTTDSGITNRLKRPTPMVHVVPSWVLMRTT